MSHRPGPPIAVRRSWWPDVLVVAAASTLLIVLALWVSNHGLQDAAEPTLALTSIGRLTGLISADLLLIQVLLMARIPWVERSWGRDQLARWHRLVGFTSFSLMVAHIVLITLGYTVTAHQGLIDETWNLVTTYPGMLLATLATAMLVLVVVTSVRAARRRLRYESWHLLHLYAYLGVGLAIPHELWTGTDFLASTAATVYWWTVYGLAAGSVLAFRLGVPVWRNLRHQFRVVAVVRETPSVVSIWLRGRHLEELPVRAGQFFTWRFLTGPGWTRGHPYSISAAPGADTLRITVKELGDDSALVASLRPGTRVLAEGPYGTLTGETRQQHKVTMMASGVGITPLRALLESLAYPRGGATLIYRARAEVDLALRAEIDELAQRRGIRVFYLLGRRAGPGRWAPGGMGSDDRLLRRLVPDLARQDVFVCGPDEWMDAAIGAVRAAGVPANQIHTERFSW